MGEIVLHKRYGCMEVLDLGKEYRRKHPGSEAHYKCRCLCGNIRYFNKRTLENKPHYCYYPIKATDRLDYREDVVEATKRKKQRYLGLENVLLVSGSSREVANEYCYRYNAYRRARIKRDKAYKGL